MVSSAYVENDDTLKNVLLNKLNCRMTYRMSSYNDEGQLMIPDLILYINPLYITNFELLVVEVKKHGNFSNGSFENDMIKLGKKRKLALDKMVA